MFSGFIVLMVKELDIHEKLGWTSEHQDMCSDVPSHTILITKPPGPFWLMASSLCVVLLKKLDGVGPVDNRPSPD